MCIPNGAIESQIIGIIMPKFSSKVANFCCTPKKGEVAPPVHRRNQNKTLRAACDVDKDF